MNEVKSDLSPVRKTSYLFAYSYLLTPEQKIIKNIPVIKKRFKNVINTNNSFLRARADYCMSRINLVVTEHKLTFL